MDEKSLYDASEDVLYEWEQFNACVDMLWVYKPLEHRTRDENIVFNALLTSFVIHARNLIYFLYGKRKDGYDDVLAEDYCHTWANARTPKTDLLVETEKQVNKLAAHLTYSRRNINRYWDWTVIRNELMPVWEKWIRCTPKHLLKLRE